MATTVDELDIQISASVSKASTAIDELDRKLSVLSKSLSMLNTSGLNSLAAGVRTLTNAMSGLKSVKTSDFTRLSSGISALANVDGGKLQAVASGLSPVASAARELGTVNFDGKNLSGLLSSLRQLGSANLASVGANLDGVKNAVKTFITEMNSVGKFTFDASGLNSLFATLRSMGGKVGNAATANLPNISRDLKAFITDMNGIGSLSFNVSSLSELITAISTLGRKSAATAATNLPLLAKELNNFMDTLSKAPAVSQNVINMTNALARFARTGSSGGAAANSLTRSLSNIGTSAGRNSSGISGLTNQLKKLIPTMGKASSSTKSLFSVFSRLAIIVGTVRGAFGALKSSIEASSDLTEVQNVIDVTFGDYKNKIEELGNTSIENFGMSELTAKQIAGRFQAMGTAMGIARGEMSDMSVQLTELAADMASFYDVDQKDVAKSLQSIFTGETEPLRRFGTDISVASLQSFALSRGLNANVNSMSQAEKAMLRYQYVLQTTGAAQGDFLRTQDTWSNQVRILKQNLQQLATIVGGVLVNAFKPLVKALNVAMGYLTGFAKTVSNALGKIFGWTYEEGGGFADDFLVAADASDDLAEGTGKAAKNIDKMKNGIRAFDELKTIDLGDNDTGDGSGGGAGGLGAVGGAGSGGEWKQTDGLLKGYESDLDSLFKLGRYISDKLKDAMESIDWDAIYKKASNFGKGLASFLNGLITPGLFSALGKTIAGGINTALTFLNDFGGMFDFRNFGYSIGTGLSDALSSIDWDKAMSAAAIWGKGFADMVNGFLDTDGIGQAGEAIANSLNTAVQFVLNAGKEFDASKLGESIADSINRFFRTFKFEDLADALNVWVDNLEKFIGSFLSKLSFEDIFGGMKKFFGELDLDTILLGLVIVAPNVISGMLGICDAFLAFKSSIGGLAELFAPLTSVFSEGGVFGAGGAIATASAPVIALTAAVAALVAGLGYVFATNEDVRESFFSAMSSIKEGLQPAIEFLSNKVIPDLKAGWEGLQDLLKPFCDFLVNTFTSIWQDMINPALTYIGKTVIPTVTKVFENLWNKVLVPLANFMSSVLKPVIEIVSGVLTVLWQNVVVPLAQALGNVLGKAFEGLCDIANNVVIPEINAVISVFQFLWNNVFSPIVNFLRTVFKPVFESVFSYIGDLIGGLSKIFGGLIDFIAGAFTGDWRKAWQGVKDIFSGIWDTLSAVVKAPLNAVISVFEGLANAIIKGWNKVIKLLNKVSIDIPDWVPEVGGEKFGFNLKEASPVTIPRLATGGIVYKPTMAQIGEAGKEGILPLTNRPAMRQMVSEILDAGYSSGSSYGNGGMAQTIAQAVHDAVLSAMRSGDNGTVDVTLNLDGNTIYQNVLRRNEENQRANRYSFLTSS